MESNNPMIRLVIFGKLKRMINSYKGIQLHDTDKKLIRGLFMRNLKDFDENEKEINANKSMF